MEEFNIDETQITKAIVNEYLNEFNNLIESDAVIVGLGPAGVIAATKLAEKGFKVLAIERNIKPGGGMFVGGMLMNKLVVEKPAQRFLIEANVKSLKKYDEKLFVCDAYEAATKLLAKAFDSGVKLLNAVEVVDVVYRKDGIKGVVINWHMVKNYPEWVTCTDPLALKTKVVIDATGHAAEIAKIAGKKIGFNTEIQGLEGSMWVSEAEKATIENTIEIYPGLIVTGMAANGVFSLPRMGPIFGAMFLSGEKAAILAEKRIMELKHSKAKLIE